MPLTGERTVPGIPAENYWFRRHEAAYAFARELVAGACVLEVGCGEGYGTAMLASSAGRIVGIDYDALTISHCAATYPAAAYPTAAFVRANLATLPIATGSVDVVVTLQVVEHVWNHDEFVRECLRVLRPGGLLFMTTPNRLTFSPGSDVPLNLFHTKEFTADELAELLTRNGFVLESVAGLHAGDRLRALDDTYGSAGSFVDAQLATPPDEWPGRLAREVASVRTDDFVVLPAADRDVDRSLDLIISARR